MPLAMSGGLGDFGHRRAELRVVLDGEPGVWFRGMCNAVGATESSPDGKRFAFYRTD